MFEAVRLLDNLDVFVAFDDHGSRPDGVCREQAAYRVQMLIQEASVDRGNPNLLRWIESGYWCIRHVGFVGNSPPVAERA